MNDQQKIEVDVKNAETIQLIIDNANTSYDVNRLLVLLLAKYNGYATKENMRENLGDDLAIFRNDEVGYIFRLINGLIESKKSTIDATLFSKLPSQIKWKGNFYGLSMFKNEDSWTIHYFRIINDYQDSIFEICGNNLEKVLIDMHERLRTNGIIAK